MGYQHTHATFKINLDFAVDKIVNQRERRVAWTVRVQKLQRSANPWGCAGEGGAGGTKRG